MKTRHFRILLIVSILALASAACFLFPSEPAPEKQSPGEHPTEVPTLETPSLTLRLPDGRRVNLPVVSCRPVGQGETFSLQAVSGEAGASDRAEIQISGFFLGAGQQDNFTIRISLGPQGQPDFQGESLNTPVTINEDGSGSFSEATITNAIQGSGFYTFGEEYRFSAEWTCVP